MAFRPSSPGTGTDHSELTSVIIANSATITLGDAVAIASGYLTNGAAAAPILGIVVGFTDSAGTPLAPTAYAKGTTAVGSDVTSVVAAADNVTVAKKMAIVETSMDKKWSAEVNGTIGTTNQSNLIGAGIDVDSAGGSYGKILESTSTRTAATCVNFMTWGLDPADSTRAIVSIACSYKVSERS